jgi:hypothetical protein
MKGNEMKFGKKKKKKKIPIDQTYYGKKIISLDKIKIGIPVIWTCLFV